MFEHSVAVLVVLLQGISDMIMTPGQVNIDMADIQSVMRNAGTAMMGTGSAAGAPGSDRAVQAARQAVQAPLLLQSVSHATGRVQRADGKQYASHCFSLDGMCPVHLRTPHQHSTGWCRCMQAWPTQCALSCLLRRAQGDNLLL